MKIILFTLAFFQSLNVYADSEITFKNLIWGGSPSEVKSSKVFKNMSCPKRFEVDKHTVTNCFADTTLLGTEVSASIDFLDNKLVNIVLSYYREQVTAKLYDELLVAFDAKFGSPISCSDKLNPTTEIIIDSRVTLLNCAWRNKGMTMAAINYRVVESTKSTKRKPFISLDVAFGTFQNAEMINKLTQKAFFEEEKKKMQDF